MCSLLKGAELLSGLQHNDLAVADRIGADPVFAAGWLPQH
jgi:hypothetical protein